MTILSQIIKIHNKHIINIDNKIRQSLIRQFLPME